MKALKNHSANHWHGVCKDKDIKSSHMPNHSHSNQRESIMQAMKKVFDKSEIIFGAVILVFWISSVAVIGHSLAVISRTA